jgi:hypothetical protein
MKIQPKYQGVFSYEQIMDGLSNQDILYFYVNRLNGLIINIDEIIGNRTDIHVNELENLFVFDNCSYVFRGKVNIEGPLPIEINDLHNISIQGNTKSSSIIDLFK